LPAVGLRSPRQGSARNNGNGEGIKLPPIGHFSVGNSARNSPHLGAISPTTPGSPLRQGFGRN
jgi:histone deacetylase 6